MRYMTSGEARQYLRVSAMTLKRWKDLGKIKYKQLSARKFLYDADSVVSTNTIDDRANVVYARVSNTKQQDDLNRQIRLIKEFMISNGIEPTHTFSEIASGMNEQRQELMKVINLVTTGKVKTVYISYKDRLTRFGFGYFESLFSLFGTEIKVINLTAEEDFQTELTEDLISIIHHFSMKMYSNRRKSLKILEKELKFVDSTN